MKAPLPAQSYLDLFLAPLQPMLARADVTDIYINVPGEIWIETLHGRSERHPAPLLDAGALARLARQIASTSHQGVSREHPLLAATLPDGARAQIVMPPATRGNIAIAIRKHVTSELSLTDYADAFEPDLPDADPSINQRCDANALTRLAATVRARKNIVIAGGTSTGKTTFLNALIKEIPREERLIVIEDTPELQYHHENAVGLVAVRSALGETRVTTDDLLQAALRMRPDRIILGEIRGAEAYTFLRAVNTGHPGSMTTIHADSPSRAIEQLALIILQSGSQLRWDDVVRYVESVIDVFVQLQRHVGKRSVKEVRFR